MQTNLYAINKKTAAVTLVDTGTRGAMSAEMNRRSNVDMDNKFALYDGKTGSLITSTFSGGAAPVKGYMKYDIPGVR